MIHVKSKREILIATLLYFHACSSTASSLLDTQPALASDLISQQQIETGEIDLQRIRAVGELVFTTPFNRADGLGDGPTDPQKKNTEMGNRPGIQNSYTPFLRVNGLDGQTCLECHSVLSRAEVPMTFTIGGHGGLNNSPVFMPTEIDVENSAQNEFVFTNGRFINPPFLFGAGGVELVAKEMTEELQKIRRKAQLLPAGKRLELVAKGVRFGTVTSRGDGTVELDIEGDGLAINDDLVVRPFGRKGEFFSIRGFDVEAMKFHFGLQPVEVFGENVDDDGDGVFDEISVGEMSALSTFIASMPKPRTENTSGEAQKGRKLFHDIGCSDCHVPEMHTKKHHLSLSFPEVPDDSSANVYLSLNMTEPPMSFDRSSAGGLRVELFSDLKRHDMGAELAETNGNALDPYFVTARLWGVADSAPYLHDGRALTIGEAIVAHGGEALQQRRSYESLSEAQQKQILAFLQSLRVPQAAAMSRLLSKR